MCNLIPIFLEFYHKTKHKHVLLSLSNRDNYTPTLLPQAGNSNKLTNKFLQYKYLNGFNKRKIPLNSHHFSFLLFSFAVAIKCCSHIYSVVCNLVPTFLTPYMNIYMQYEISL